MIIGVATAMAARGVMTWRRFILHGTIGTVLAAIPAFPILQDIFSNPDFGHAFGFDYVDYLKEFWPYHFLFEAISLREKAGLGAIVVLGAAAFVAMGRRSFFFLVALASLGLVYAIGIAIPFVTHSAVVLNLHLLRVSTILQLLAILGCLTLATRWWFLGKPLEARLLAPALVLIMCVPIKMTTIQPALHAGAAFLLIVAALSPTARQRIPDWLFSPKLRLQFWVGAIVVTGFLIVTARNAVSNIQAGEWLSEWKAVGQWAKSNTSPTDVFLVPTWSFQGSPSQDRTSEDTEAILNSGAFEAVSDRAVWIDFRQGAAVMWSPSNYAQWHRRVAEVNSLASPTARQEYARAHGIKYLIEVCRQDPPHTPLFSTKRLCVYDAS
jgi:hypothetical protein